MRNRFAAIRWLGLILTGAPALTFAQTDFSQCLARLESSARQNGVSAGTIAAVLPTVVPRPRVVAADRQQAEFVDTFGEYLGRRVTESRVESGRTLLARHATRLGELTREFGVPGQYIVAFWGLETNYGNYLGDVSVFDSLSTLACDTRRSGYFSDEFVNALKVVDLGHVEPETMIGSWAGAMGQTQFMPSNYLRFAIDGDGDDRVDLWSSVDDALASAANFLRNLQWRPGERWGREVILPDGFDYALAGREQSKSLREWSDLGVTDVAGHPLAELDLPAAVIAPAGRNGPAFVVYGNFDVIMRWNRSEFFALTVGHLADRIAGGSPLYRTPPASEGIAREHIIALQRYLVSQGYDSGTPDGILGPLSRAAIRRLQSDRGEIADGHVSRALLETLNLIEVE